MGYQESTNQTLDRFLGS